MVSMKYSSCIVVSSMIAVVSSNFIPVVNIESLRTASHLNFCEQTVETSKQIFTAAVEKGFFYISNHGVEESLLSSLDDISKEFFARPVEEKRMIDMKSGGKAWRGFFAVGDEVTSGIPDQKEGIYFGTELSSGDDRPLHGINQWPQGASGERMKEVVLTYMGEMKTLGQLLMRAISCSLNVTDQSFTSQFENPTELFRIFNYPPHNEVFGERALGVGEHTDYGYLTLLKQDSSGGLQVKDTRANVWVDADPIPGTFVVNLGDALEHATWGLLKATPHRVKQRINAQTDRLSMPYFFDPCFDCEMQHIIPESFARSASITIGTDMGGDLETTGTSNSANRVVMEVDSDGSPSSEMPDGGLYTRWDGADPTMFTGTYGSYLLRKVSRAFPALFAQHITQLPQ